MEGIDHRIVSVNGIKMHIAEKGQGPVVLFLHGFPELWYSWRHQIHALVSLGYHAVAPDLRASMTLKHQLPSPATPAITLSMTLLLSLTLWVWSKCFLWHMIGEPSWVGTCACLSLKEWRHLCALVFHSRQGVHRWSQWIECEVSLEMTTIYTDFRFLFC